MLPGTAIGATVVIAEFFFFRWMMNPITPPAKLNGLIWGWKLKKVKKTVKKPAAGKIVKKKKIGGKASGITIAIPKKTPIDNKEIIKIEVMIEAQIYGIIFSILNFKDS